MPNINQKDFNDRVVAELKKIKQVMPLQADTRTYADLAAITAAFPTPIAGQTAQAGDATGLQTYVYIAPDPTQPTVLSWVPISKDPKAQDGPKHTDITSGAIASHFKEIDEAETALLRTHGGPWNPKTSPYQVLDLSTQLTTSGGVWHGLTIEGTKAFFVQDTRAKWMTADYDATAGTFSNFAVLDLTTQLITSPTHWNDLKIEGTKAFFVNKFKNKWMTADYDATAGTFSNFATLDLTAQLTTDSTNWNDLTIVGTKAFFVNNKTDKWMTADYDATAGTFSNFAVLDLTTQLTIVPYNWIDLKIEGTKAFFVNIVNDKWMTADYDATAGTFSNFATLDLSHKLTTSNNNWYGLTISGIKAFFANFTASKWMETTLPDANTETKVQTLAGIDGTDIYWSDGANPNKIETAPLTKDFFLSIIGHH